MFADNNSGDCVLADMLNTKFTICSFYNDFNLTALQSL